MPDIGLLKSTMAVVESTFDKDNIRETEEIAKREVGIDPTKGDIFKSPTEMMGGILYVYNHQMVKEVRFVNILYASETTANKISGTLYNRGGQK